MPRSAAPGATRSGRGRRSASSATATSSGSGTPRTSGRSCGRSTTGGVRRGEHLRVFPLSNWTELDVWQYIAEEEIALPELYFAREREVFERDGMLYRANEHMPLLPGETVKKEVVRFRTIGDMTCTGAVKSNARTLDQVIAEVAAARLTERGATRADDRYTEAAMEDRKREGYF